MPIVRLGTSGQVLIPTKLRDQLGLEPGDDLEVEIQGRQLVLTPNALVDRTRERHLVESLADLAAGRTCGPFDTAREAVASMKRELRRRRAGRRSTPA